MQKQVIEKNFTRYAKAYHKYSEIQREVAELLIEHIDCGHNRILDIGCGLGYYTSLIASKHKNSKITAVDVSANMIAQAQGSHSHVNIEYKIVDAEKEVFNDAYTLVTSNASLHWFEDFEQMVVKIRDILPTDGQFVASVFGNGTYCELADVLDDCFFAQVKVAADSFMNYDQLEKILKGNFRDVFLEKKLLHRNMLIFMIY